MATSKAPLAGLAEEHRLLLRDLKHVEEMAGLGGDLGDRQAFERAARPEARGRDGRPRGDGPPVGAGRGLARPAGAPDRTLRRRGTGRLRPAVLARAPHLDRKVRALLAEHGDLARALEAVIRKEEAARSADAGLRQALATWLGRMRRHESEENQLVEDAFNCEPCAGD